MRHLRRGFSWRQVQALLCRHFALVTVGQLRAGLLLLRDYFHVLDVLARRLQSADVAATLTSGESALQVDRRLEDLIQLLLLDVARDIHVVHVVVDVAIVSREAHQFVAVRALLPHGLLSHTALNDRVVCVCAK